VTRFCVSSTLTWMSVSEAWSLSLASPDHQKQPRQRDGGGEPLLGIDQKQRIQVLQQVGVALSAASASAAVALSWSATYSGRHHAAGGCPPRIRGSSWTSVFSAESISPMISRKSLPPVRKGYRRPRPAPSPRRCPRPSPARGLRGCWPASWDRLPRARRRPLRCRWFRRWLAFGGAQLFDDIRQVGRVHSSPNP